MALHQRILHAIGRLFRSQVGSLFVLSILFSPGSVVWAQSVLKVAHPAWAGLIQPERDVIQKSYLIEVVPLNAFGIVIDNQGVNESTLATNGGARLGSAVANAAYIDTAIRGGDYSAKSQLGAILLGGILGSSLDSKGTSQFHQRYAVRMGDGNIQYFDQVKSDPFRHPVGVCVTLPAVELAPDQQLCTQTADHLRARFVGYTAQPGVTPPPPPPSIATATVPTAVTSVRPANVAAPMAPPAASLTGAIEESTDLISCRLNSLAPVRTTVSKCNLINGRIVND